MSVSVLGIDIAKQKFDVALLVDGKVKHKTCKNSAEGFETLPGIASIFNSLANPVASPPRRTFGEEYALCFGSIV